MAILYGFIGILFFSLTLPATRATVGFLDPVFVGCGRGVVAACLAALTLACARCPLPPRRLWPRLALVSAGGALGFPLLSALALQRMPASHGAILTGLLPLATAGAGAWLDHERPGARFWWAAALGSAVVIAYALAHGSAAPVPADGLLLLGLLCAALGYAVGGRLARSLGGWQVIAWSLLLALPLLLPAAIWARPRNFVAVPAVAWIGFGYMGVGSMFLGFVAWYQALALGGIARTSQIQLLQPFLTLAAAATLLGEHVGPSAPLAAVLVLVCVVWGRTGGEAGAGPLRAAPGSGQASGAV